MVLQNPLTGILLTQNSGNTTDRWLLSWRLFRSRTGLNRCVDRSPTSGVTPITIPYKTHPTIFTQMIDTHPWCSYKLWRKPAGINVIAGTLVQNLQDILANEIDVVMGWGPLIAADEMTGN